MKLSDQQLASFQALYKKEFNKEISSEEAYESAIKLLTLLKTIYKPMTKEAYDRIQKKRKAMISERSPLAKKRLE